VVRISIWFLMVEVDGLVMALFSTAWLLIHSIVHVPVLIIVMAAGEVSCMGV